MSSNIQIERICEHCGNTFTAQTTVTRYCTHKCSSQAYKARKRAERVQQSNIQTKTIKCKAIDEISNKPYLSITEVSLLIGVARQTIYNLIHKGELKMGKFGNRTIIRRVDIDSLLDKYTLPTIKESEPIIEYYTIKEVEEPYNIKYGRLNEIVTKYNIPKKLCKNKLQISKKHIDKYFAKVRGDVSAIKTWYSVNELMERYELSRDSIYKITFEKQIPKKQQGKYVLLSSWHFDNLGLIEPQKTAIK